MGCGNMSKDDALNNSFEYNLNVSLIHVLFLNRSQFS